MTNKQDRRLDMKWIFTCIISIFTIISLCPGVTVSQDLFIYPKKGQDSATLEKDKYECYQWAKQQSGVDPSRTAEPYSQQNSSNQRQGEVARGAARGALAGAVIGEIANDDAGKGAAIGAVGGGFAGGKRRRDRIAQSQSTQQQQYKASEEKNRTDYNRAYAACLEARDYTVK
jgi:outer membrane lipoprotein SlyB